jgi:polysaccharide biosynthesis protein PelF
MRGGVVVAADVGGLSEVVGDAGLKFFMDDSQALAARLRQIHDHPALLNSLGSAARERAVRFFDLNSMIQKHVDLYEGMIPH